MKQSTSLLGEAIRCVHIGDRESDIYELFCTAQDAGTQFLLRTCVDRLAGDGKHTIATEMAEVDCKGLHRIEVRDRHGKISEAVLELKFRRILVQPPMYKQRRYPALELTVLHATERGKPRGRDRIDWKLITNLPVTSRAQAIEKLHRLTPDSQPGSSRSSTLQSCLIQLACLGGYLNRAKDPPPGNMVIWRGMSRLTDIEIGFLMATENVGN